MRFTLLLLWMVLIPTQGSYGNYEDAFKSVSEFWNQVRDGFFGPSKSFRARSIGNSPRIKKSTDPFTDFHEKMALTARVFAGISLRIGLYDGTMAGDEVIKELLSIDGSVNLDTVESFDKPKVDAFFTKILNDPLADLDKLESTILSMHKWTQMYEKITKPDNVTAIKDYIKDVNTFFAKKYDKSTGQQAKDAAEVIRLARKPSQPPNFGPKIGTLKTSLKHLKDIQVIVPSLGVNLKKEKSLLDYSIRDSSFYKMTDLIHDVFKPGQFFGVSSTQQASFGQQSSKIAGWSNEFGNALESMKSLVEIGKFRQSARPDIKITSGFINGATDVSKLQSDVKDVWIQSAIPNYDVDFLEKELQPLDQLNAPYVSLSANWKKLDNNPNKLVLEQVADIQKAYENVKGFTTTADQMLTTLKSKLKPNTLTEDFALKAIQMKKNIDALRRSLIDIIVETDRIGKLDLTSQISLFSKMDLLVDEADVGKTVANIQNFGDISELQNALGEVEKEFSLITESAERLDAAVNDIIANEGAVAEFVSNADFTSMTNYLDTLKPSANDFKALSEIVKFARLVRTIQGNQNFKTELQEVTKAVKVSANDLQKLRSIPALIKSSKTPRIEDLEKMKGIDLKSLSDSILYSVAMKKTLQASSSISTVLANGFKVYKMIETELQQNANDEKKRKALESIDSNWGNFGELSQYFNTLLKEVEKRTKSITSATSLVDTAEQFGDLQGLESIDIDLKQKLEALEDLSVIKSTQELDALKGGMEELVELDLAFANHQTSLTSVKQDVQTAVSLFASASQTVPPNLSSTDAPISTTVPGEGPLSSTSRSGSTVAGSSPTVSNTAWIVAVSISSALALIFLLLATGFGVNWYWMKKKVDKLLEENARLVEEKRVALNEVQHKRVKAEDNLANCNKDLERLKKEVELKEAKLAEQQAKQAQQSKKGESIKTIQQVTFDHENLEAFRDLASLRKKLKKKTNEKDALVVQLEETRQRENDSVRALEEADIKYRNSIEMLEKGAEREARLLDLFDKAWTSLPEGMLERRASPEFWKADRYGKLTFVDFTVPEFKYVFSSLEPHRVHEKHIKKHHNRTIIQIPYLMPWLEAQAEVDRQQLSSAKQESLYLRAVQYPIPKAYDHALAADDYDVTRYTCSYGTVGFVCRQPDFTVEGNSAFLEMLWKLAKTEKTKLWGCISYDYCSKLGPKYFHFDPKAPPHRCGRFEVLAHSYKRNFREMLGLDYYKLEIREDPSVNNAPDRRVLFLETFDLNIRWDIVPTTVEFQKMVKYLLVRLARIKKRRMIVMDEDGGPHAAIFMASEYFAQYYATHGCCHASMYHPLEEYLSFRGHVFTRPDQVMFAMSMGLDLMVQGCDKVPAAHKDELVQLMRAQWEAFYNGSDKMEDEKVKKEENLKSLRQLTEGSNHGTIMCEPDPALIKPQPPQ